MTNEERLVHPYTAGPKWSPRVQKSLRYWSSAARHELTERLGAYEDTGFSPEELKKLAGELRELKELIEKEVIP